MKHSTKDAAGTSKSRAWRTRQCKWLTAIATALLIIGIGPSQVSLARAQEVLSAEMRTEQEPGGGQTSDEVQMFSQRGESSAVVAPPSEDRTPGEEAALAELIAARQTGDSAIAAALLGQLDPLGGMSLSEASEPTGDPTTIYLPPSSEASTRDITMRDFLVGDVRINNVSLDVAKPSITSAPNGDLYAAVESRADAQIYLYRSTDGGATWGWIVSWSSGGDQRNPSATYVQTSTQRLVSVAYEVTSATAATRDVRVFNADLDNLLGSAIGTVASGIVMASSGDEIHPEIATDNVEYPNTPWLYVTYAVSSIDYYPVYFSRSTDRGATWSSTPIEVTGGSENTSWATRPQIAYGQAGLFIAFVKPGWTGATWANQVWITQSTSFGSSWNTPVQLTELVNNEYHPVVAAAHGRNSVVVAYTKDYTSDTDVDYAYSTDGGTTWAAELALPWTLSNESSADLAVSNSLGRFHVAYWHEGDIWYTSADTASPNSWTSPSETVNELNFASFNYPRPTIAVNPTQPLADEAAIAWTDYRSSNYDVYFDARYLAGVVADNVGVHRSNRFYLDVNGSHVWDAGDSMVTFGMSTDIPVTGDWNGDGVGDVGVRRSNRFYLDLNGNDVWDAGDISFTFGLSTDIPVVGDWNGDGFDDVGVRRGNLFYLDLNGSHSWNAGDITFSFGLSTDVPVVGDWNGDGVDDVGIRRGNLFYIDLNGSHSWNAGDIVFSFGLSTDVPVIGDWNADGVDDVGIHRDNRFYLDANGSHSWNAGDISFSFGLSTDTPLAGKW